MVLPLICNEALAGPEEEKKEGGHRLRRFLRARTGDIDDADDEDDAPAPSASELCRDTWPSSAARGCVPSVRGPSETAPPCLARKVVMAG